MYTPFKFSRVHAILLSFRSNSFMIVIMILFIIMDFRIIACILCSRLSPYILLFLDFVIKTLISNLVRTTRFGNNLHQVRSNSKSGKPQHISLGAEKKIGSPNRLIFLYREKWILVLKIIALFRNCTFP
jgi:hypothetical protein